MVNYKKITYNNAEIELKSHPSCFRKYYVAELESAIKNQTPGTLNEHRFNAEKNAQTSGSCNPLMNLVEEVQQLNEQKKMNSVPIVPPQANP